MNEVHIITEEEFIQDSKKWMNLSTWNKIIVTKDGKTTMTCGPQKSMSDPVEEFEILRSDLEKIKEWDRCKNKNHGAIGGHLTYEFTITGIGVVKAVKCDHCGDRLDLTDYEGW